MPLEFVMTRVFDMYHELATRERTVDAAPRAPAPRVAHNRRETAE